MINLENSKDEDEPVVEDTYPWQMKTIKCRLGEISFEILMIRYSIPRSITLRLMLLVIRVKQLLFIKTKSS